MLEDGQGCSKPFAGFALLHVHGEPSSACLLCTFMAHRLLLLAAGGLPSDGVAAQLASAAHEVIAVDGGLRHAQHLGVAVDIVLGDLDSVAPADAEGRTAIHLPDQDRTDLSKSLSWCMEHRHGAHVDVVGLDGGRLDHRQAVAAALIESGSNAVLHLEGGSLRRCPHGVALNLPVAKGTILGLHPMGVVRGVHLQGTFHDLANVTLGTGTRGVHNVATSTRIRLQVQEGDLVLSIAR
jgi:thiamine pyrophosphokinase